MMNFTDEQINLRIKQLPLSIQNVILSDDFIFDIQEIGGNNDLFIWQIGALEKECKITFLGLHKSSDFIENVKKTLTVDQKKAEELQKEVNEKIFIPMRHIMVEKTTEDESILSKEDILNEIENPMSSAGSISVSDPVKTNEIQEDLPSFPQQKPITHTRQPIVISSKLLDDKLSEIVKLPSQQTDIVIDVDAIDQAEEEHKRRKEEARKIQEQQKIDAEQRAAEKAAQVSAISSQKSVDSIQPTKPKSFPFGKKDLPPLRVRKSYESDPYREVVE